MGQKLPQARLLLVGYANTFIPLSSILYVITIVLATIRRLYVFHSTLALSLVATASSHTGRLLGPAGILPEYLTIVHCSPSGEGWSCPRPYRLNLLSRLRNCVYVVPHLVILFEDIILMLFPLYPSIPAPPYRVAGSRS